MSDPIVKVVVDCSVPDRDAAAAYTLDQVESVLKRRVDGKLTSEEASEKLLELAELAAAVADIPDRVTITELTDEELAEYHERQAASADDDATADASRVEKDSLVADLTSGKATDLQVRQALAKLLGG